MALLKNTPGLHGMKHDEMSRLMREHLDSLYDIMPYQRMFIEHMQRQGHTVQLGPEQHRVNWFKPNIIADEIYNGVIIEHKTWKAEYLNEPDIGLKLEHKERRFCSLDLDPLTTKFAQRVLADAFKRKREKEAMTPGHQLKKRYKIKIPVLSITRELPHVHHPRPDIEFFALHYLVGAATHKAIEKTLHTPDLTGYISNLINYPGHETTTALLNKIGSNTNIQTPHVDSVIFRSVILSEHNRPPLDSDIRALWNTRNNLSYITRGAKSKDIGGNNNNDMKASYTLHDDPGGLRDNSNQSIGVDVGIDYNNLEAKVASSLTIGDPMKNIEDLKLIRGRDASQMSDDEILNAISDVEAQKKRYADMPTKTKTGAAKIKELQADIDGMVAYLDRNIDTDADAS